jgi:RND family efflux transporter MFP subunit
MKPTAAIFALAACAIAVAGCGTGKEPAVERGSAPAVVRAEPVESVTTAHRTRAVGTLAPRDEIRLAFKAGGIVELVHVDSGETVRKGQVLAELKRTEIDATLAQAAEAAAKSRRDLERGRRLRADEVATEEQVENLTTAFNVAQANLQAARFNAQYARIEAPADGIVFERLVETGELVAPGQPVVVLGSTDSGWVVRIGLADRDVMRVTLGTIADVTFDAYPGKLFKGTVSRIGAAADRMTGTFEVEVEVQPGGMRFARGLVAKVELPLADQAGTVSTATVVPVSALVDADGRRGTVYVLDAANNVARRKEVTLGAMLGEQVVVTTGLTVGEAIITDGAAWLTDGRTVRVVGDDRG